MPAVVDARISHDHRRSGNGRSTGQSRLCTTYASVLSNRPFATLSTSNCKLTHVQLKISCRPIESFRPAPAREHTLRSDRQHLLQKTLWHASVPKPDLGRRDAGVHAILLQTETDERHALPMAPNQASAGFSVQGAANLNARSETMHPAADAVAKVLAIALAGVLLLWTPPVLSDSVATMDSSRAPQTDGADLGTPAWERALRLVREAFPEVPQMTTGQLAALRTDDAAPDIVLLDARTAAEFNVSHLPGAVLASNIRMALDALTPNDLERTVVVYCSVGYRSSQLAAELRARGFENVSNLEGSLFQWANEGRPLYRGDERVYRAHPYDKEWGQLLDKRFWAD